MASKSDFPGVALVTGAASGIGLATANAFAKAGCTRIILADLNLSGLTAAQSTLTDRYPNLKTLCLPVDISVEGAMEKALETAIDLDSFGRLDYAVNCAGMNGVNADHKPANSTETSVEYFDKLNSINYRGTWMANRAYLKIMMAQDPLKIEDGEMEGREQRGSIVNLSSGLGVIGMPKNPVYSASKAAIISLTRSDAIDYSEYKIRINCVCPGLIDTPMTTAMGDEDAMKWVVDSTPLKRLGKASEIADTCVFLSSMRASWIQGQSIIADGGIVLL